nr:nuclear factor of activated T-cells c4 isoform VI-IXL [Mus musculus]ACG55680.1 nuclear factor of activated T-cells c4 isoform VIi-IXL [Mus musculus]
MDGGSAVLPKVSSSYLWSSRRSPYQTHLSGASLPHRVPPLALTWTSHRPGPLTPPIPMKTLLMRLLICQKALVIAHPLCTPRRGPHRPIDLACGCSLRLGVPQVVPAYLQSLSFRAPFLVINMEDRAPLLPWGFHSPLQPPLGRHCLPPHHSKTPSIPRVPSTPYLLRATMRWGQAIPLGRGLRSRRKPGVATAAASETVYLSRVSPWRK